ncbi:hypothetical protein BJ165DRAFT_1329893, partial [Panaeolus papilionaceus]
MYDTYTKNADIVTNTDEPTNSARKLVVKMVNSLSSKTEIGAPYAALVLLGNPDHYTSHEFVCFYWKGFIIFVQKQWKLLLENAEDAELPSIQCSSNIEQNCDPNPDADIDYSNVQDNENVTVTRSKGHFMAKSSTDDYRFQPTELENVCLYEWVQCAVRQGKNASRSSNSHLSYFPYQPEHPLSNTYLVACDPDRRSTHVPNFIGPPLPRRDVGDYEDYCCTMLSFFCPWRTGIDLKSGSESWEDAFNRYPFTDRQRELMDNFNLKYECYDARDDFAAKRAATGVGGDDGGPTFDVDGMDQVNSDDWVSAEGVALLNHDVDESECVTDALDALKTAGWTFSENDTNALLDLPKVPPQHRDSRAWEAYIKKESARLWKAKFATLDVLPNAGSTRTRNQLKPVRNDAWITRPSYLSKTYTPVGGQWGEIMDEVAAKFTLNEEQNRAFRIIGNHASTISPDQLLMHLGGMGGTGKSCVIHALVNYFNRRDEPYRFVLLGPTGTAAALIGGSTYHSFLGLGRSTRYRSGRDPSLEDLRE